MRLAAPRVKLTYDDFLLFPDDGQRHELIDGEHYVTPSPRPRHQVISGNLYYIVRTWLETHPDGRILYAPLDVVFSNFDIVVPDLVYVSNERWAAIITEKHAVGAPDLVIEIGSPSTRERDETIKCRLYERCGVTEYWIVDPTIDVVRVYRRLGDRFGKSLELRTDAADVLTTPLLPGLAVALQRIFADR